MAAGTLIKAIYAAHNANGWGPFSDPNTAGAVLETVPNKMAAPTRDPSTTTLKLVVDWVALVSPENGYTAITSYNLQWDRGTAGATWYNLIGYNAEALALTFTASEYVTAG